MQHKVLSIKTNSINPGEDLKAIRELMEKSYRYMSLSGLSGVSAGFCALFGAAAAWFIVLDGSSVRYDEFLRGVGDSSMSGSGYYIILIALLIWAIGFGLMHIVYGTVMYFRHER